MTGKRTERQLLITLFGMSQATEKIDIFEIQRRLGSSLRRTLEALNVLADAGLVDAERLRLTLAGLAVASASSADRSSVRRGGVDEDGVDDDFVDNVVELDEARRLRVLVA